MNKCTLLVQILSCKSIKINNASNQIVKLRVRLLRRKKIVAMNLIIWNKKSLATFEFMKKLDYVIIEGKLHKNNKILKNSKKHIQKNLVFSASSVLKYKSLLKNKDIDLFIK